MLDDNGKGVWVRQGVIGHYFREDLWKKIEVLKKPYYGIILETDEGNNLTRVLLKDSPLSTLWYKTDDLKVYKMQTDET
jgi:hypothetical protein